MDELLWVFIAGLSMLLVGLMLLAAARWHGQVLGVGTGDRTTALLLVPAWVLTLLGSLTVFVMLAHVLGCLLWLVLLVVLAMAFTHRRVGRRRALLRLLAAMTRAKRPLAPAVAAFAQESPGRLGDEALRLHAALDCGTPLANALVLVAPLAPTRERALLYLGQQTNELTSALEAAADDQEPDEVAGEIMAQIAYLFWILLFAGAIVTFVMLKIVPAFKQIFNDFNMELPSMTVLLVTLSDAAGVMWPILVGFQIVLWGVFLHTLLIYIGWIQWRMPLPVRWLRGLDTSAVLRGLALTAEARRPLDQGVDALATAYPDIWIRHQLDLVCTDLAAGIPWWESLWLRRLISTADRALLQAAQRVGNVPWALRTVAERHRWRLTYRLRWWLHLFGPPLLVLVGMLVGFIVIALFMPLIRIIESLS